MFYPPAKSSKGVRWQDTKNNNTLGTAVSARYNFLARNRLSIYASELFFPAPDNRI
jgi:hypothetical protein